MTYRQLLDKLNRMSELELDSKVVVEVKNSDEWARRTSDACIDPWSLVEIEGVEELGMVGVITN